MFNAIMDAQIAQIKCIPEVASAQHVCRKLGNEIAKRGPEIVCLADGMIELDERDVLPVSRKNAYDRTRKQ